ncbi:MAG TPA: hypothetical protein VG410_02470 [Solirubrobacteraceae bacterium]|nr:hypothetical protein [Solirubrobacteraceae bacterium]
MDRLTTGKLSERDRAVLEFAAEHKLVLAAQVAVLLGVSEDAAARRMRGLRDHRLLFRDRPYERHPPCYQATERGLRAIGNPLRAPRSIDRQHYRHDVGVGWLWLAARAGVWGELAVVVSERTMRSRDGTAQQLPIATAPERFGVRLGGYGPGGRERLHYADLLLVDSAGHRIALELELSAKDRPRREKILAGYAADARIDAVLYLVDRPAVGAAVRESARRMQISDLVHVQPVRWGRDAPPAASRGAAIRSHRRTPARAAAQEGR